MIRRLSTFLFTDVKALQAFHLMRQGATLLIAVLLTKTGLQTEVIGAYEMLLYLGSLVSAFWVQGLIQGFLSEYPRLSRPEQRQMVVNAYGLFLLMGLTICMTSETTCPAVDAPTATATVVEPTVAPEGPTATSEPTEEPTATVAPASPTACVGEGCDCSGGVEGNCGDDLVCCQTAPGLPGGTGTCEQSTNCDPDPCGEEGCLCATGTASPCDAGMICCTGTMPGTPTAPGAPGICRKESQCGCSENECHCNGGVQGNCDQGLSCCQGEPSRPGGPGLCLETCPPAS